MLRSDDSFDVAPHIEVAHDFAMNGTAEGIQIIASKVGDDAGILGGAVLARRETK